MIAVLISFLFFFLAYILFIIDYNYSWSRYPAFTATNTSGSVFISVVIPVRNESENIEYLLDDLSEQVYSKENFEIIIVNDHSDDNTVELAEKYKTKLSNCSIYSLDEYELGKKQAINFGVKNSRGELIVTIDGDCRVKTKWLSAIASYYIAYKPKLIIGPLLYYEEKNLFGYMQSLEVAALVASGAGATISGKPVMCNGANLAFTKNVYLQSVTSLKNNIASGDDLFLLLAVKKMNPHDICFLKSTDAVVYTKPLNNIGIFFKQRKRWASKWIYYRDKDVLVLAMIVFLCNLSICLSLILSFLNFRYLILFLVFMSIKSVADLLLLNSFTSFFEKKNIMKYFWPTQLIYPFYIVFTAIFSNLGKLEWKKRIY